MLGGFEAAGSWAQHAARREEAGGAGAAEGEKENNHDVLGDLQNTFLELILNQVVKLASVWK